VVMNEVLFNFITVPWILHVTSIQMENLNAFVR